MTGLQILALAVVFWGGLLVIAQTLVRHLDDGWPWWSVALAILLWGVATWGVASL